MGPNPPVLARSFAFAVALGLASLPALAEASPPEDDASEEGEAGEATDDTKSQEDPVLRGSFSLGADGDQSRRHIPWLKRWIPEPRMLEFGVYGGVFLLAETHELFGATLDLPDQGYKPLNRLMPEFGVRVGYYPIKWFGVEAEGGVMPTSATDDSGAATIYTVRGQLIGQLAMASIVPFVTLGGGALGVSSPRNVVGSDVDPALHFGGGVKFYIHRLVMLRIDVRDVVTHKQSLEAGFVGHNLEALLGLSITLGRRQLHAHEPSEPATRDRDGDGIPDDLDGCPDEPETINDFEDTDGCPETDSDGDGIYDKLDACIQEPETFNEIDDEDGCPEGDDDGDGFLNPEDSCPAEPETDNGYEDDDGCPDEVPLDVAKFTGSIKGITFDTDRDTIRKSSRETLDGAAQVLGDHPSIKIEISGHTDNQGERDHNLDLSRRRAEAVKQYLVEQGIDESRITTVGYGPDKPIDTNDTKAGRANNRRIEFHPITRPGRAGRKTQD